MTRYIRRTYLHNFVKYTYVYYSSRHDLDVNPPDITKRILLYSPYTLPSELRTFHTAPRTSFRWDADRSSGNGNNSGRVFFDLWFIRAVRDIFSINKKVPTCVPVFRKISRQKRRPGYGHEVVFSMYRFFLKKTKCLTRTKEQAKLCNGQSEKRIETLPPGGNQLKRPER